ncbi:zinc finger protein 229 [Elysia marginata]|uniref:Zinc finger protein 229 n=1 Tax=Elysia marginata TaxID=1093978 RepID=A0AAV4FIY4_9GAST|nr:zinc finger protein 229 [Elysia marginata]
MDYLGYYPPQPTNIIKPVIDEASIKQLHESQVMTTSATLVPSAQDPQYCKIPQGQELTTLTKKSTPKAEKPFKCDICGKGFKKNKNLHYHKISHLEDKPYNCDVCGKGYA